MQAIHFYNSFFNTCLKDIVVATNTTHEQIIKNISKKDNAVKRRKDKIYKSCMIFKARLKNVSVIGQRANIGWFKQWFPRHDNMLLKVFKDS